MPAAPISAAQEHAGNVDQRQEVLAGAWACAGQGRAGAAAAVLLDPPPLLCKLQSQAAACAATHDKSSKLGFMVRGSPKSLVKKF